MEVKSKKKLFNGIMVALIVVIVGCGIMAVGNIKGWFGSNSESPVISDEITGVANMERDGVAYTLSDRTPIKAGDILETKSGSKGVFNVSGGDMFCLGEKTSIRADACDEKIAFTLNEGDVYSEAGKSEITFSGGNLTVIPEDAVFSMSVHKGSREISVFSGSVSIRTENEKERTIESGSKIVLTEENASDAKAEKIPASSLSEFQIEMLLASDNSDICFSSEKLNKVVSDREKEQRKAEKALEQEAIAVVEGNSTEDSQSGDADKKKVKVCTIQIQCKSILSNMGNLKEGKNRYVPSNGVILATSKVEFNDGDTAYDVTKRACSTAGIQIEAAYTPAYGSYYVEGINHLYEFDCGETSGWMYKVNGWAPNYGCSEYKLEDGDSIVWYYTCSK
ncbi:MAG: DUF4430 domain-containing protein [Firmicutes bacterium]|nr:DUF4430 domain-containing protein [Bacillota bacterium]